MGGVRGKMKKIKRNSCDCVANLAKAKRELNKSFKLMWEIRALLSELR